ncbi:MAG: nicotinamide mononucleotide transporter [Bacteroidetes bacterium]|nr:nicotinamide mononucleotide transporter [Bacteroidota bacterium]MBK9543830.1 nicotinamide mononucleotide transporter [Bacteroidota bacterium]MBL0256694.1 nicotinamide mononucleotide transporter [Bacteroidota bacterium]MBP6401875.1 nicotinamide mononucleotide transporter [Bacteroidia bacterium]MBP6649834.1 nicotinamide mononucleotide transporter [Bacteroidia bacterium]
MKFQQDADICVVFHDPIFLLGQQTSLLEIVAMLTGLAGVWLTVLHSAWCFPLGIVNVILYAILFFSPSVRLYADSLLQCIYVFLLIFGWINWNKKNEEKQVFVPEKMSPDQWKKVLLYFLGGSCFLGYFFEHYTDAALPWLDSALTSASLVAQWMVAKKKIENWIIWIFANSIYVPLFFFKHLPLTAFLYVVFLVMAVSGFVKWKKIMPDTET